MTCANEKPALIRIGVYLNSEGHIRGKHLTNSFLQCISFIRKDAQMQSFKFSGGCLCNSHILIIVSVISLMGFPCGSASKESSCNVGDLGSIPGLGRYPGEGKGYPLQYSGLENSMDSEVPRDHKEMDTTEWLFHFFNSAYFVWFYLTCFFSCLNAFA